MGYRVRYITHREKHHANHSGYDLLGTYLGTKIKCIDYSNRQSRIIPWRLANRLIRYGGVSHYGHASFYHELSAMLDMLHHRNTIYHILYGDTAYRYLGWAGGLRNNKVVATLHYPPKKLDASIRDPSYFKRLNGIIIVGRNQKDYLELLLGRNRIFWVPHPIDTQYYVPLEHRSIDKQPICLSVGSHLRDFFTLRNVATNLSRIVRFVVVTTEENKEYLQGLVNVTVKVGISEKELLRLYQTCTVSVQPLKDSTANNALLEGISCGAPTVVTDVGGVRDYVNEQCAILVPPVDPEAMTEAILNLISDENHLQKLSKEARRQAKLFSYPIVATKMLNAYTQIMDGN
jgi:glycosyltransferase involved in cell wall biosynthesis